MDGMGVSQGDVLEGKGLVKGFYRVEDVEADDADTVGS